MYVLPPRQATLDAKDACQRRACFRLAARRRRVPLWLALPVKCTRLRLAAKQQRRTIWVKIQLMHICLFDIDGTLIHTRGAGTAALREGLRSAFGVEEPTDQVAIHGRTDRGITRDLFRFHGIDDLPEHWERFRAAYLRALPESLAARAG